MVVRRSEWPRRSWVVRREKIIVAAEGLPGLFDLPGLTGISYVGEIGLNLFLGKPLGWGQTIKTIAISNPADIMRNMLRIQ
jgi:hypothetical protein